MRITESNVLVLDTETTGTSTQNDRVVEIGGCVVASGVVGDTFGTLVNPGIEIPPDASKIHGIWPADVQAKPSFEALIPRLQARIQSADMLCGYNAASFDLPLLQAECLRYRMADAADMLRQWPFIDPMVWLRRRSWHLPRSLGEVSARYGLTIEGAHTAAGDAKVTGQLLLAMIDNGEIPNDFDLALTLQDRWQKVLADERAKWGHWLYCDFLADGPEAAPRVAVGKTRGVLVTEADDGLIEWALGVRDMHQGAGAVFQAEYDRRRR